jgi:hypothetical protein
MKSLIPGLGDRTTKKRLRELEKQAGTLPVIFALLFTESVKTFIGGIPIVFLPETAPFRFAVEALKFLLLALVIGALYIFEEERREYSEAAKDKAQTVKEKVEDTTESAKDKANKAKDKAKDHTSKD